MWTVFLAVLLAMTSTAATARADDAEFESAVRALAQPSGDAVTTAVRAIAGDERRGLAVLEGLRDGRLIVVDADRVLLRDEAGAFHDAVTGAPVNPGEHGRAPTVDNEVRRVLEPTIARMQLRAPSTEIRLIAVETLAQRSD